MKIHVACACTVDVILRRPGSLLFSIFCMTEVLVNVARLVVDGNKQALVGAGRTLALQGPWYDLSLLLNLVGMSDVRGSHKFKGGVGMRLGE